MREWLADKTLFIAGAILGCDYSLISLLKNGKRKPTIKFLKKLLQRKIISRREYAEFLGEL